MVEGKQLVFIVGSGRSGTTLLRNILEKHPQISVSPELKFLDVIIASRQRLIFHDPKTRSRRLIKRIQEKYARSEDPLFKKFPKELGSLENLDLVGNYTEIFLKLWKHFGTKPEAPIWVEKTPSNVFFLDRIIEYFPKAKVINMTRDGREVVASAKKRNWAESTLELVIWWRESIRAFDKWKKHRSQTEYLEIRYEDLVGNLESELGRVFNFLDLPQPDKAFFDSLKDIESFSSFFGSSKKGVYESSHFRDFFSTADQEIIESVIQGQYSLTYLFLLTKIRLHLLTRRLGIFWIWSGLGTVIRKFTR